MVDFLVNLRSQKGRLFILGVGGGAGHASHAVNDFRKICGIESYTPSDNVSELTARVNDDGWDTSYVNWLKGSNLTLGDMIFVFSGSLVILSTISWFVCFDTGSPQEGQCGFPILENNNRK